MGLEFNNCVIRQLLFLATLKAKYYAVRFYILGDIYKLNALRENSGCNSPLAESKFCIVRCRVHFVEFVITP